MAEIEKQKFDKRLGYEQILQNLIVESQTNLTLCEFGKAHVSINNLLTMLPKEMRPICKEKIDKLPDFNKDDKETIIEFYNNTIMIIKDELEDAGLLYGIKITIKSNLIH